MAEWENKSRLVDMNIEEFTAALGSGEPTPGGGAAASLSAAMGAALLMMVANHTIGNSKYAEFEPLSIEVRERAEALRVLFIEGVDRDADAFLELMSAFAMPRSDDASKSARSEAIGAASLEAAAAPMAVMEGCVEGLELAEKMLDHSNPNLRSDVIVAAHCLYAGLESASCNVYANLPAIARRAPQHADSLRARAEELRQSASSIAARITGA